MQYTPGPWIEAGPNLERNDGLPDFYDSVVMENPLENGGEICKVNPQDSVSEQNANASLIAAAPDMYEALQLAMYYARNGKKGVMNWKIKKDFDKIDDALAKADGENDGN